jgi:hypothetical protein
MQGPGPDSRIVYIDGAFDLFHAGHVEVNPNFLPHAHPQERRKRKKEAKTITSANKSAYTFVLPFVFSWEQTDLTLQNILIQTVLYL